MRTKQKANEVATAPSMVEAVQHAGDVWDFGPLSDIFFYFFCCRGKGRRGGIHVVGIYGIKDERICAGTGPDKNAFVFD